MKFLSSASATTSSTNAKSFKTATEALSQRRRERERETRKDGSMRSTTKVKEWMEKGAASSSSLSFPSGGLGATPLYSAPLTQSTTGPSEYETASSLETFEVPIDLISFDGHAEEEELCNHSVHDHSSLHKAWEDDLRRQAEERYKLNKEKEMMELDERLRQWMNNLRDTPETASLTSEDIRFPFLTASEASYYASSVASRSEFGGEPKKPSSLTMEAYLSPSQVDGMRSASTSVLSGSYSEFGASNRTYTSLSSNTNTLKKKKPSSSSSSIPPNPPVIRLTRQTSLMRHPSGVHFLRRFNASDTSTLKLDHDLDDFVIVDEYDIPDNPSPTPTPKFQKLGGAKVAKEESQEDAFQNLSRKNGTEEVESKKRLQLKYKKTLKKTIPPFAMGRTTLRYAPTPPAPSLPSTSIISSATPPHSQPISPVPPSTNSLDFPTTPTSAANSFFSNRYDSGPFNERPKFIAEQQYPSTSKSHEVDHINSNKTPEPPSRASDSSSHSSHSNKTEGNESIPQLQSKAQGGLGLGRPTAQAFQHSTAPASQTIPIDTNGKLQTPILDARESFDSNDSYPESFEPVSESDSYVPSMPGVPIRRYVYGEPLSTTFEETEEEDNVTDTASEATELAEPASPSLLDEPYPTYNEFGLSTTANSLDKTSLTVEPKSSLSRNNSTTIRDGKVVLKKNPDALRTPGESPIGSVNRLRQMYENNNGKVQSNGGGSLRKPNPERRKLNGTV